MRNYENLKASMTVETMAELGVRLVSLNNRELYYMTSTGQLYTMNNYEAALQHEYNWLMHDPNLVKTPEDSTESTARAEKIPEENLTPEAK